MSIGHVAQDLCAHHFGLGVFVVADAGFVKIPSDKINATDSLPRHDLISTGVLDLQHERETIPALLAAIGEPKITKAAIDAKSLREAVEEVAEKQ